MLTDRFVRDAGGWVTKVNGKVAPERLRKMRIPPAWVDVRVDPDPKAYVLATGFDVKGRLQRLYSPEHKEAAKGDKFERIRALLEEESDIEEQIKADIQGYYEEEYYDRLRFDAALIALLIFETGIRPGSNTDTLADVKAYGATTLRLSHVKPCVRGVRLQFTGKKGVSQNILVENPVLVREFLTRKSQGPRHTTYLFRCSSTSLCAYFRTLGSGGYTPKDFRTMRGTRLALRFLGGRTRFPKAKSKVRKILNDALDRVAKHLGNTRAVSRNSYVDPAIMERFVERIKGKTCQ